MLAGRRVLVLEDEPLIAKMLADWLTELGCTAVGPARTIQGALSLLDQGPIDAGVVDVSIGSSDCAPVADALQIRGIPFAFATGHARSPLAEAYPRAHVLSKPYDFAAVRGALMKMLADQASTHG